MSKTLVYIFIKLKQYDKTLSIYENGIFEIKKVKFFDQREMNNFNGKIWNLFALHKISKAKINFILSKYVKIIKYIFKKNC
jgi:hypothetical protein